MAHLDLIFSDDSQQRRPERPGMEELVSAGALHIPGENALRLERNLEGLCERAGFPAGDEGEFKWSPSRDHWMRENLVEDERFQFFREALGFAREAGGQVMVVLADTQYNYAIENVESHQMDVTVLLIERIEWSLRSCQREGLVVVDTPSGNREQGTEFLRDCRKVIASGTRYLEIERFAVNVVSAPSRFIRCLQLADVITGATTSFVSGESRWSPPVFDEIRPMLRRGTYANIGGTGVKIHPDLKFGNLYHWLLGDTDIVRGNTGHPLPMSRLPYSADAMQLEAASHF